MQQKMFDDSPKCICHMKVLICQSEKPGDGCILPEDGGKPLPILLIFVYNVQMMS